MLNLFNTEITQALESGRIPRPLLACDIPNYVNINLPDHISAANPQQIPGSSPLLLNSSFDYNHGEENSPKLENSCFEVYYGVAGIRELLTTTNRWEIRSEGYVTTIRKK